MHPRLAPALFALLLTATMSFVVSGVATFRAVGAPPGFFGMWVQSWLASWVVAFPVAMVVAPLVRRVVDRLVRPRP